MTKVPVDLEFSEKYDGADAERYAGKYRSSQSHTLSIWREVQVARKALMHAGEPSLVLDLPCGSGRFWPMLAEKANRQIIAADSAIDRVAAACKSLPAAVLQRVKPLVSSAHAIELPDGSVDSIFSVGLFQRVGEANARALMLKEFHRVTRDTVVLSLWVGGNFKAWQRSRGRKQVELEDETSHQQGGYVIAVKCIEAEFVAAGFIIQEHLDVVPLYAMSRIYILRKV